MDQRSLSELLPLQDVPEFIRFPLTAAGARRWMETLPRANIGDTTRAVYQAVTELNRCQVAPRQRLAVLDTLRLLLDDVRGHLARHYLGQPVVLPRQAAAVVQLVETLNLELAQNYARVAAEALGRREAALIAIGVAQASAALNANLLLACQLYRAPVKGNWRLLHCLHAWLCDNGLEQHPVDGWLRPDVPYLCALLLGSAHPNQLGQSDLGTLYARLCEWADRAQLIRTNDAAALWSVDPLSDDGPVLAERAPRTAHRWALDTRAVAEHIDAYPDGLNASLCQHLQSSWGNPSSRGFVRLAGSERFQVTLGLTATHHFIASEKDFQTLASGEAVPLGGLNGNPFLHSAAAQQRHQQHGSDIWNQAYGNFYGQGSTAITNIDYNVDRERQSEHRSGERYRYYEVESLNSSPGGYCLQWPPDAGAALRAGELIGLRSGGRRHWSIATIRWVQLRREGPNIGVQLLSPTALPYAARPIGSKGAQGDYQRVLVLPEVRAIGQPTTLITPHLPFREGQRVELMQYGQKTSIKLTTQIASTGVFSQFEFRQRPGISATDPGPDDTGFDALWNQL